MGSYDITCSVSDFGISPGDSVKLLFIHHYYKWAPVSFFVDAVYDDYGRFKIPDSKEKQSAQEIISLNVVEKSTGSNEYHEKKVLKDQKLEDYIESISQDRLFFHNDSNTIDDRLGERAKYFPLWKDIESLVGKDFVVSESGLGWGTSSIRAKSCLSDVETLIPLICDKYSYMVCAGKSVNDKELILAPKPGGNNFYSYFNEKEDIPVGLFVIRSDVFSALKQIAMKDRMYSYRVEDALIGIKSYFNDDLKDCSTSSIMNFMFLGILECHFIKYMDISKYSIEECSKNIEDLVVLYSILGLREKKLISNTLDGVNQSTDWKMIKSVHKALNSVIMENVKR